MKIDSSPFTPLWVACLIVSGCLLLLPSSTEACAVPVFKYALAYWPPDPYEVIVFHRGELPSEEQILIDKLKDISWNSELMANVNVRAVDLADSPGAVMQKLWESQTEAKLPWMVLKYPRMSMITVDVWDGLFTKANVEALLNSPARREIARRILKGEVAVWVLLESGDKQQDDAAATLLERELKRMSETLEIIVPDFTADEFSEDALKVSFSTLRLSRTDPREEFFVQMLLNTEWDLKTFSKPIAFPVFGRGRALYALVGEGIWEDNIEAACAFLVGWCSCQVKEQNPGVDLLMSVNWDNVVSNELLEQTTMLIDSTEPDATEESSPSKLKRNIVILGLAQFLGIIAIAGLIFWRRRHRE